MNAIIDRRHRVFCSRGLRPRFPRSSVAEASGLGAMLIGFARHSRAPTSLRSATVGSRIGLREADYRGMGYTAS